MIIGAVNEAIRKVEEIHATEMEKITGGLSLPGPVLVDEIRSSAR